MGVEIKLAIDSDSDMIELIMISSHWKEINFLLKKA